MAMHAWEKTSTDCTRIHRNVFTYTICMGSDNEFGRNRVRKTELYSLRACARVYVRWWVFVCERERVMFSICSFWWNLFSIYSLQSAQINDINTIACIRKNEGRKLRTSHLCNRVDDDGRGARCSMRLLTEWKMIAVWRMESLIVMWLWRLVYYRLHSHTHIARIRTQRE